MFDFDLYFGERQIKRSFVFSSFLAHRLIFECEHFISYNFIKSSIMRSFGVCMHSSTKTEHECQTKSDYGITDYSQSFLPLLLSKECECGGGGGLRIWDEQWVHIQVKMLNKTFENLFMPNCDCTQKVYYYHVHVESCWQNGASHRDMWLDNALVWFGYFPPHRIWNGCYCKTEQNHPKYDFSNLHSQMPQWNQKW